MDLDSLKANWNQVGSGQKSQNDLLLMTKLKNHPHIKRMKLRFALEAALLVVFITIYYDAFDGSTKPLWVNLLLIGSSIVFLSIRIFSWLMLRNPAIEDNLKQSLQSFQLMLKRIGVSLLLSALLFGLSILIFFTESVELTQRKYAVLTLALVTLGIMLYLSSRNWLKKIKEINSTLSEFQH